MNHASGKDYDPSAWAKQRQERIKRASQLREKRQSGSPDKNHTFKPQLQANLDGAVSKLPLGAKVGDAAGPRRGTYDLTRLDSIQAFPLGGSVKVSNSRTSGYSDESFDDDVDDGNRGIGEDRDSLDQLQASTPDRKNISSVESVGHALRPASSQPPPPPLHPPPIQNIGFNDGFNGHHDGSHANGYNGYSDSYQYPHQQKSRSESGSGGNRGNNGQIRQGENGAGRDALSHEVDQRPNVRGSLSKAMSPTSHQSSSTEGGARRVARTSHPNRSDYDGHGRKIVRYPDDGSDARTSPDEHDAFYASLRGGGARGGSVRRGSGGGGRGCAGKKQAVRRPEWNSDTATVDFLGDPRTVHVTDNSPLAIQSRIESRRRSAAGDPAHDSPYAPPGVVSNNSNNRSTRNNLANLDSNDTDGSWKHKHTKTNTMPWGEHVPSSLLPDPGSMGQRRGEYRNVSGSNASVGVREGYRSQMMPSSSIGSFALYGDSDLMDRRGIGDFRGETTELPAEKEQLRRNLSLLKKKIHSQAGSRRSQSAGPRAVDVYEDEESQNGNGSTGPRLHFHMTTGTAPATMPAKPGEFSGRERGLELGGKRAAGGRTRPPAEGPGSPYVIDPRNSSLRVVVTKDSSGGNHQQQQSSSRPHDHCQQHQDQHRRPGGERNPLSKDSATYDGGHAGVGERSRGTAKLGKSDGRAPIDDSSFGNYGRGDSERETQGGCGQHRTRHEYEEEQQRQLKLGKYSERYDSGHRTSAGSVLHGRSPRKPDARAKGGGSEGAFDSISNNRRNRSPDRRRAWGGEVDRGDGHGNRIGRNCGVEGRRGMSRNVGDGRGAVFGGYEGDLPKDAFPDEEVHLVDCRECGRKFKEEALERHAKACRTVFLAKRKVFNAAEMRTKGTELEKYVKRQGRGIKVSGKGAGGKNKTRTMSSREFDETPVRARGGAKPSKWRQQSSQFREAIRQAKVVTDAQNSGKSLADLPPPKPSEPDPSFVTCPHCGRRFNEVAGERHILHCKNIRAKPSVLKKGSGSLLGHAARAGNSSKGHRW